MGFGGDDQEDSCRVQRSGWRWYWSGLRRIEREESESEKEREIEKKGTCVVGGCLLSFLKHHSKKRKEKHSAPWFQSTVKVDDENYLSLSLSLLVYVFVN